MNDAYYKMLLTDELKETFFFSTGIRPIRNKTDQFIELTSGHLNAKIYSTRKVDINGTICKNIRDIKHQIGQNILNL